MSNGTGATKVELACLARGFEVKIAVTGFCAIFPARGGVPYTTGTDTEPSCKFFFGVSFLLFDMSI
jgi:hypothetical protein